MLKFKTSCAVLAYLSSNLLNEVGLSLFRYFEVGLRVCDIVVKKFTFAISSPDEFLLLYVCLYVYVVIQPLAAKPNKSINQSPTFLWLRTLFIYCGYAVRRSAEYVSATGPRQKISIYVSVVHAHSLAVPY